MKLLIDMGNTAMKWCYGSATTQHQVVIFPARVNTDFFYSIWSGLDGVEVIWLSTVGSAAWLQHLQDYANTQGVPIIKAHSTLRFGPMRNAYKPPESLGVDRWLAAIAAWYRVRQAVIVVDAGTAITVDAVTDAGVFIGGVILPGWMLCKQALVQGTAALEISEVDDEEFPDTTSAAIHRGALLAVVGGVQAAVRSAESALGGTCCHLLCGGDSTILQRHLAPDTQCISDLVLRGLLQVASD
ncbi:MAG TPA: type III pantothenate kinase [Gammaproteobacteria bacterium]|nr:type III pantothenate kinase [Gammaproteobacteria bacterium]